MLLPNPVDFNYHQLFQTLNKTRQQAYMCLSPRVRIKTWQVQVKIRGYPSLLRGDSYLEFLYTFLTHIIESLNNTQNCIVYDGGFCSFVFFNCGKI